MGLTPSISINLPEKSTPSRKRPAGSSNTSVTHEFPPFPQQVAHRVDAPTAESTLFQDLPGGYLLHTNTGLLFHSESVVSPHEHFSKQLPQLYEAHRDDFAIYDYLIGTSANFVYIQADTQLPTKVPPVAAAICSGCLKFCYTISPYSPRSYGGHCKSSPNCPKNNYYDNIPCRAYAWGSPRKFFVLDDAVLTKKTPAYGQPLAARTRILEQKQSSIPDAPYAEETRARTLARSRRTPPAKRQKKQNYDRVTINGHEIISPDIKIHQATGIVIKSGEIVNDLEDAFRKANPSTYRRHRSHTRFFDERKPYNKNFALVGPQFKEVDASPMKIFVCSKCYKFCWADDDSKKQHYLDSVACGHYARLPSVSGEGYPIAGTNPKCFLLIKGTLDHELPLVNDSSSLDDEDDSELEAAPIKWKTNRCRVSALKEIVVSESSDNECAQEKAHVSTNVHGTKPVPLDEKRLEKGKVIKRSGHLTKEHVEYMILEGMVNEIVQAVPLSAIAAFPTFQNPMQSQAYLKYLSNTSEANIALAQALLEYAEHDIKSHPSCSGIVESSISPVTHTLTISDAEKHFSIWLKITCPIPGTENWTIEFSAALDPEVDGGVCSESDQLTARLVGLPVICQVVTLFRCLAVVLIKMVKENGRILNSQKSLSILVKKCFEANILGEDVAVCMIEHYVAEKVGTPP